MKFSWGINRDNSLLRPGTSVLVLVLSYHIHHMLLITSLDIQSHMHQETETSLLL